MATILVRRVRRSYRFGMPLLIQVLGDLDGVEVWDDPAGDVFPTSIDAAGGDVALAGRIRQAPGRDDALVLFSCADNLRAGAALDAVQMAEHLYK